jgi:hypothetical protein
MEAGDIDSNYFHGQLPGADGKTAENWIPRWQNCRLLVTVLVVELMADDLLREIYRKGGYSIYPRRVWKASST